MTRTHLLPLVACLSLFAAGCSRTTPASTAAPATPGASTASTPDRARPDGQAAGLVSVGSYSGCVLTRARRIACWGSTAEEGEPAVEEQVRALADLETLAVGDLHACAIDQAGVLHCWGDITTGALGLPVPEDDESATPDAETPVSYMSRPLGDTPVAQVDVSSGMTCAVTRAGKVLCMGTVFMATNPLSRTRELPGMDDAVQVAVGEEHGCVLTRAGKVLCWGENLYGEAGPLPVADEGEDHDDHMDHDDGHDDDDDDDDDHHGDDDDDDDAGDDDDDDGSEHWHDEDSEDHHTDEDDTEAEVDSEDSDDHWAKYRLRPIEDVDEVVEVAVGNDFSCARQRTGQVLCWGSKRASMFDYGADETATPEPIAGMDDAISLSAGAHHACAVDRAGWVACWGGNTDGQLGNGTTASTPAPVRVKGVEAAARVAVSDAFSCVLLSSGSVRCWGKSRLGALGTELREPAVVTVPELAASRIFAFGNTSCALADKSGELSCWGAELTHWWRQGAVENSRRRPLADLPVSSPRGLLHAWNGTCALSDQPPLMQCWSTYPAGADGKPTLELAGAVQMVNGYSFTCARLADETVWCITRGSMDLGTGKAGAFKEPTRVPPLHDVRHIGAADSYACAVARDGSLQCFGSYPWSAAMDATKEYYSLVAGPTPPTRIAGVDDAVEVAGTSHAVCVRTHESRVRCAAVAKGSPAELVDIGLADMAGIVATRTQFCARSHAGAVSCWSGAAVRDPATIAQGKLVKPQDGVADVVEMAAGSGHVCGRRSDGRVLCWGQNEAAQLGRVPRSLVLEPHQVYPLPPGDAVR